MVKCVANELRLITSSVKIGSATFSLQVNFVFFYFILVHENITATNVIWCDVDENERSTIKQEATLFLIPQEGITHCRKSVCLSALGSTSSWRIDGLSAYTPVRRKLWSMSVYLYSSTIFPSLLSFRLNRAGKSLAESGYRRRLNTIKLILPVFTPLGGWITRFSARVFSSSSYNA